MRWAALILAGCATAPPAVVCKRGGEVVYRGPAHGAVVTDDGIEVRVGGGWRWVEADRCWWVR